MATLVVDLDVGVCPMPTNHGSPVTTALVRLGPSSEEGSHSRTLVRIRPPLSVFPSEWTEARGTLPNHR